MDLTGCHAQTEDRWPHPKIPKDNTQAQELLSETSGAKVLFEV